MQINYKATLLAISFAAIGSLVFGANEDRLVKLDAERNDLLKEITNELSYGHMKLADAEALKGELDNVVSLETKWKEGRQVKLDAIAKTLQRIRVDVKGAIYPKKVWMGIDSHNMAIKEKIDALFASGKLTKEEAENLGREEQTLRDHETVNDSANGLEFDDAVSIAKEIQQLNRKIAELSNK